ncbi:NAD(P)-dependent alcohol dehydrogenase [Amycolatopsis sp. NPDC006125]|uniref:NAD(P)-dependent alcohol dehydrogenase n=1 Tax=unclassified Amycolatopsis TaxID=2618356 RepID=UPI00026288C4
MSMMRAAQYDRYGPPDVLYEGKVAVPQPRPGQILVRVQATSVNGGELSARAGQLRLLTGKRFPKGIGLDFVGEVADPGSGDSGLRAGDRVWGVLPRTAEVDSRSGAAAEYLTVDPDRVSRAPAGLTPVEAASLVVAVVPIIGLRDKAHLARGERLLVRGASGGTGSLAVQVGKAMGAHVTGLAGPSNLDFVRGLGADEVVSYTTAGPADLGSFDVVFDTVGTELAAFRRLLTPTGRMVAISFDRKHIARSLAYIAASVVHGSRRVRFFSGNPKRELFAEAARLAESGELRPVVDGVHPLSAIAEAHRAVEAGGVRGKHIIDIDGSAAS